MTRHHDDEDRLRRAFARLRAYDMRRVPPFAARQPGSARTRFTAAPWRVLAPALAAAAGTVLFVFARSSTDRFALGERAADTLTEVTEVHVPKSGLDFLLAPSTTLAKLPRFEGSSGQELR